MRLSISQSPGNGACLSSVSVLQYGVLTTLGVSTPFSRSRPARFSRNCETACGPCCFKANSKTDSSDSSHLPLSNSTGCGSTRKSGRVSLISFFGNFTLSMNDFSLKSRQLGFRFQRQSAALDRKASQMPAIYYSTSPSNVMLERARIVYREPEYHRD